MIDFYDAAYFLILGDLALSFLIWLIKDIQEDLEYSDKIWYC